MARYFLQVLLEDYNGVLGHAQGLDTFDQKKIGHLNVN